jgi:hypothetical protein
MKTNRFWEIIAAGCRSDPRATSEWNQGLFKQLVLLKPDEILEFDRFFDAMAARAYTVDLWGAAYTINGGASDDGFYYFRCWLIGMGRRVYEAALKDPDSLAEVVDRKVDAEVETYAEAQKAWQAVTGKPDTDYSCALPARNDKLKLDREFWDFRDESEVRRRFPRLAAIYLNE